jgi:hypothetical protein
MNSQMNTQPPSQSEQIQAYLRLTEAQMKQFNETRTLKWKINTALWAFLAYGMGAYLSHSDPPRLGWELLVFVPLWGLHFCWVLKIQKSLDVDKKLWIKYRQKAGEILGVDIGLKPPKGQKLWAVIECGVTAVLMLLFVFVALSRSYPQACYKALKTVFRMLCGYI